MSIKVFLDFYSNLFQMICFIRRGWDFVKLPIFNFKDEGVLEYGPYF